MRGDAPSRVQSFTSARREISRRAVSTCPYSHAVSSGVSPRKARCDGQRFEGTFADERFDASAHITLARDEGSGGIVATVSPPLPGFPAAGIEDEATDSILLLGLRGTHFGDGKGILWSNNVLWTRVGAPSCGPGCVLT